MQRRRESSNTVRAVTGPGQSHLTCGTRCSSSWWFANRCRGVRRMRRRGRRRRGRIWRCFSYGGKHWGMEKRESTPFSNRACFPTQRGKMKPAKMHSAQIPAERKPPSKMRSGKPANHAAPLHIVPIEKIAATSAPIRKSARSSGIPAWENPERIAPSLPRKKTNCAG